MRLVAEFAEREPQVAGKPMSAAVRGDHRPASGASDPLVVGDRLDTDIEGAVTMGWDSLLVLTGVTGLDELVCAEKDERPTYIGSGPRRPAEPHQAPEVTDDGVTLGGWSATVQDGRLTVRGTARPATGGVSWPSPRGRHLDDDGQPVETDGVHFRPVACRAMS